MRGPQIFVLIGTIAGCSPAPTPLDADVVDAAGMDASRPSDGGPLWVQLGCVASDRVPSIGADAFCPADHDYVGGFSDAALGDAGLNCPDGDDAGCTGWTREAALLRACSSWITCELEPHPGGCFHCPQWAANPY